MCLFFFASPRHEAALSTRETIDMYLYRNSEYKAKQIGKVEIILKKTAIDKYFFKNANYLSEKDIGSFKIEPAYRYEDGKTKSVLYKHDEEYSRVCSFSKYCNYMKDDKPIKYNNLYKSLFLIIERNSIFQNLDKKMLFI